MSASRMIRRSAPSQTAVGETDFKRLDRMTDRDIDRAIEADPDAAPALDDEWFRNATLLLPERKVPVSMRIDREILEWFKRQGRGYQSRMHAVLAAYYRAHSAREHSRKPRSVSTARRRTRKRSAK